VHQVACHSSAVLWHTTQRWLLAPQQGPRTPPLLCTQAALGLHQQVLLLMPSWKRSVVG
jgi:hypothetical protein